MKKLLHPFCYRVFWNEWKAVIYFQAALTVLRSAYFFSVQSMNSMFCDNMEKIQTVFMILYMKNEVLPGSCSHEAKIKASVSIGRANPHEILCNIYPCKYYVAQFGGWGLFVCLCFYVPQNCSLIWRRGGWGACYLKYITVCHMDIYTKDPSFKNTFIWSLVNFQVCWWPESKNARQ